MDGGRKNEKNYHGHRIEKNNRLSGGDCLKMGKDGSCQWESSRGRSGKQRAGGKGVKSVKR